MGGLQLIHRLLESADIGKCPGPCESDPHLHARRPLDEDVIDFVFDHLFGERFEKVAVGFVFGRLRDGGIVEFSAHHNERSVLGDGVPAYMTKKGNPVDLGGVPIA